MSLVATVTVVLRNYLTTCRTFVHELITSCTASHTRECSTGASENPFVVLSSTSFQSELPDSIQTCAYSSPLWTKANLHQSNVVSLALKVEMPNLHRSFLMANDDELSA